MPVVIGVAPPPGIGILTEHMLGFSSALPRHVGFIMDGNGRWAEARGLPRLEGHKAGTKALREVVRTARELRLEAVTMYAFSSENWGRPPAEVAGLMALLCEYLLAERDELMSNQIRFLAIGELARLPDFVTGPLNELVALTSDNAGMTLTLALSYGGRESLAAAARALGEAVAAGTLAPLCIDVARLGAAMPTFGLPPLDLVIRTSGEQRISNFMLWEMAYAELMFVDAPWPDFGEAPLRACLAQFGKRSRRFGLTPSQL